MSARRLLRVGPLPLALVFGLATVARSDVIKLIPDSTVKAPGGQISGQITDETPTQVRIRATIGGEQAIPVDQIDSVSYDSLTPSFTLAESRENVGSLVEAAELYQKATGEAQGKPFVERAAQFGRARVLTQLGLADPSRADEAIGVLDAFVRANGSSRQLGSALENLIRLSLQKGDTARAESALTELSSKVPWAADRAAVFQARILSRKGQYDQAVAALDKLIAEAPEGSAKAREAMLAKAESLAASKKYKEAEAVVRDVIKGAPPEDATIQAEAHNTLGDCRRVAGRPKDALIAYLKTDVLYDSDKAQHPRALAQIAQIWRELKQDRRADEVLERLRQQYPQSPWASAKTAAPR